MTWHDLAACNGKPTAMFYPETGEGVRRAIALCLGCPVRDDCLEHALTFPELFGVWGGMSEKARKKLRRDRGLSRQRGPRVRPQCGTTAGYGQHRYRGEEVCAACNEARLAYESTRRRWVRRQKGERRSAECGTVSGYQWHIRNNHPPCDACREANTRAMREYRAVRKDAGIARPSKRDGVIIYYPFQEQEQTA